MIFSNQVESSEIVYMVVPELAGKTDFSIDGLPLTYSERQLFECCLAEISVLTILLDQSQVTLVFYQKPITCKDSNN